MKQKAKVLFYTRRSETVRVMLGKRIYGEEVFWWLPGGSIEEGESPFVAVIRELYEELVPGPVIKMTVDQLLASETEIPCIDYHTPNAHYLVFLVEVSNEAQEESVQILDEFDEIRWFDLSDMPENMSREYSYLEPGLLKIF